MNYFQLLLTIDGLYDRLQGKTVTVESIIEQIESTIPYSDVRVTFCQTLGVVDRSFIVAGEYDPEVDEEGGRAIELEIQFPREPNSYHFSEDDLTRKHWRNLAIDIASVLGHEYMHLNQARGRHFEEAKEYQSDATDAAVRGHQEYFGITDEVDAYAFTLAASLANDLPNLREIESAPVYGIYAKTFGEDHQVTKSLVNKSKKYLKILESQFRDLPPAD